MRAIVFVMPLGKSLCIQRQLGHDSQQTSRSNAGPNLLEVFPWLTKVFDRLACRDKIVLNLQDRCIGRIELIENCHTMSCFFEHDRKCWSRSRAKIEPAASCCNSFVHRLENSFEKASVTQIGWHVFMQIVFRFFVCWREMKFLRNEDQMTFDADKIFPHWVCVK